MTTSSPVKRSKRRWLSFSLRAFLLVLTVLAISLGWIVNRANRQKDAVTWIREMGGEVRYGFELDSDYLPIQDATPFVPVWLCDAVGIDFFASVKSVRFNGDALSDIPPLSSLPRLESLSLNQTEVANLMPLVHLTCLKRLLLCQNKISDLSALRNLTNLRVLLVQEKRIKDISCLTKLKKLETLYLPYSQVSDFSVSSQFSTLEILALHGAKLTEVDRVKAEFPTCKIVWIIDDQEGSTLPDSTFQALIEAKKQNTIVANGVGSDH